MHLGEQSDNMNLLENDGLDTPMKYQPERISAQRPLFLQNINKTRARPDDYMTLSIVNAFCCMLGFIPLIFSLKSRDSYYHGDYVKANSAAKCAKIFNIIIITMSILSVVIFFGLMILAYAVASPTATAPSTSYQIQGNPSI